MNNLKLMVSKINCCIFILDSFIILIIIIKLINKEQKYFVIIKKMYNLILKTMKQ